MFITKRLLLNILLIFSVVAFLFMSFTLYGEFLLSGDAIDEMSSLRIPKIEGFSSMGPAGGETDGFTDGQVVLDIDHAVMQVGVVVGDGGDDIVATVREWCSYNKYGCTLFLGLPGADTAEDVDLLIFGDCDFSGESAKTLNAYGELGVTMIFTSLPEFEVISQSAGLADCFGIQNCVDAEFEIDGIRLFHDFYLCGDRIYTKDDDYGTKDEMNLTIPYYTLRPGYEVFAVAILDGQEEQGIKDEKMPPLLWRTNLKNSRAYVIGNDFFSGNALIGTLTAMVSNSREVFLYPIINAQMNSIINFPWLTEENTEEIREVYGHTPKTLGENIIWPSVVQTLFSYHSTADFYVGSQLDYTLEAQKDPQLIEFYTKQIRRRLATMGISLGQVSDVSDDEIIRKNREFFSEMLPENQFSTLYSGDATYEELKPYFEDEDSLLSDVHYIVSDRDTKKPLISCINGDTIQVQLITNGFSYRAKDDIELISVMTALGYNNQYLDASSVLYAGDSDDYWNNQSIVWASEITYYRQFKDFDFATMRDFGEKAETFLGLSYNYRAEENEIHISLNTDSEVSFILRLCNDEITGIEGAQYTRITDTAYLLKTSAENVTITTQPLHEITSP